MLYSAVERYKHCEKSCIIDPKDCNLHINNFQNFRSHAINKILSTVAEKKTWYLEITVLLTAHENIHNKMYHNHKTDSCKIVFQITQISQKIWPVNRFDFHHITSNDSKN